MHTRHTKNKRNKYVKRTEFKSNYEDKIQLTMMLCAFCVCESEDANRKIQANNTRNIGKK